MPKLSAAQLSSEPDSFGQNVRRLRSSRGWSIVGLAKRAGVAPYTVLRIEQGFPSSEKTRVKIAYALETYISRLVGPGAIERQEVAIHIPEDHKWLALIDNRHRIPEDNDVRIQETEERARLGQLGFVPQFVNILKCRLPKGKFAPGILELHGDLPPSKYLGGEIFAYALRGDCSLVFSDETIPMPNGTAVTFDATKPFFFRGVPASGAEPPLVLYVRLDEPEPISTRRKRRVRAADGTYSVWATWDPPRSGKDDSSSQEV